MANQEQSKDGAPRQDGKRSPDGEPTSAGGTWKAEGADSAPLGSPEAGLSDRNGPSDPDNKKQ